MIRITLEKCVKEITQALKYEKICNKCGKEFSHHIGKDPKLDKYTYDADIHSIEIEFKYGNVNDGTKLGFELCQDCLDELIGQFKIEPDIEN